MLADAHYLLVKRTVISGVMNQAFRRDVQNIPAQSQSESCASPSGCCPANRLVRGKRFAPNRRPRFSESFRLLVARKLHSIPTVGDRLSRVPSLERKIGANLGAHSFLRGYMKFPSQQVQAFLETQ